MSKKYVKKAVEVEAVEWKGDNAKVLQKFCGKALNHYFDKEAFVATLNGQETANPGDFIVRYDDELGKHFKVYKPDYFKAQFEEISSSKNITPLNQNDTESKT